MLARFVAANQGVRAGRRRHGRLGASRCPATSRGGVPRQTGFARGAPPRNMADSPPNAKRSRRHQAIRTYADNGGRADDQGDRAVASCPDDVFRRDNRSRHSRLIGPAGHWCRGARLRRRPRPRSDTRPRSQWCRRGSCARRPATRRTAPGRSHSSASRASSAA